MRFEQRFGIGAALAGVVWLPDEAAASTAALAAAQRNGFTNGNGVSITWMLRPISFGSASTPTTS